MSDDKGGMKMRWGAVWLLIVVGFVLAHIGTLANGQSTGPASEGEDPWERAKKPFTGSREGGAPHSPEILVGSAGGAPASPEVLQMDQKQVWQVQQQLKAAGYDPGAVDGILGPRTKAALRQFQRAYGLQHTGQLDDATLRELAALESAESHGIGSRGDRKIGPALKSYGRAGGRK
jgi:Putative peptidoglycan binding domain